MDDIKGCDPDGTNDNGGDYGENEHIVGTFIGGDTPDPSDPLPDDSDKDSEPPTASDIKEAYLNPDLVTENGINILVTNDSAQSICGGIDGPSPIGETFGEPLEDRKHWHMQEQPDTCAIVSQEYILDSYLDYDVTENELVEHATKNGYYYPGSGTFPEDVGKLLEQQF